MIFPVLCHAQQSGFDTFGPNSLRVSPSSTNAPPTNTPAIATPQANGNSNQPSTIESSSLLLRPEKVASLLRDSFELLTQGKLDAALEKVNIVIAGMPRDADAYGLRGSIYAETKMWDKSEQDYKTVLQLDSKNVLAAFSLAEVKFKQKQYDQARPGFVTLQSDPTLGDLSAYMVFLCDLVGGHEDLAGKELDTFNQIGGNPSYYFSNFAWSMFHHKTEEARDWMNSATGIYAPGKANLYCTSLRVLGYLPLPPPPPAP